MNGPEIKLIKRLIGLEWCFTELGIAVICTERVTATFDFEQCRPTNNKKKFRK